MARALIRHIQEEINGEGFTLTWVVTFYGADVPNGADSTVCAVTLGPATTKGEARVAIRQAISAEAAALGYPYSGVSTLVEELFVGL